MNPLRDSGKPLFFLLAKPGAPGLATPPPAHGLSLRVAVRSLTTMQKEALVCNSQTGAVWRLASDEGAYLAGLDEAPCPLAFFTTGMVSHFCEEIQALARQRCITLQSIRLMLDNYYTMKGSALGGTMTGGARDIRLQAWIDADASQESLAALVADAVACSPVTGMLRNVLPSYFTLTHNGNRIALAAQAKANSELEPVLPDPLPLFANPEPSAGLATTDLIVRKGMSPETTETVTRAGDSLQAEQDRVLHIRGICTVRDDGIKEVEQQLFNPHGSIFRFLCEEGLQNGGKARAPDAASYLAAGIAFCFMTQLGRYAHIMKRDLKAYRIVQDMHFLPGDTSSMPGRSEPVETHVFLDSAEDSAFAQKMVAMGEQTCFLHAFCRTALDAGIHVNVPG
jgi:organic hydroperoxide reductase OsmC/OhrA